MPSTFQNFDDAGSTFAAGQHPGGVGGPPATLPGGPTDNFIRLATTTATPDHNAISFARTDVGAFGLVVVDFDFHITPAGLLSRADGIGFVFLNTALHGTSGIINPANVAEEPDFPGSLGVGFDIHDAGASEINNNHISIHFNGAKINETDVSPVLDLASGRVASSAFDHARIIINASAGKVSVILTPAGGNPYTVIDQLSVPGLAPYEGRAQFGARSGGEAADFDLDNIVVQYLNPTQSVLSFRSVKTSVNENDSSVLVTVDRVGNSQGQVTVDYATSNGTAMAGSDFSTTTGTLTFASGVTKQSFQVPILNDATHEGAAGVEEFSVALTNATGGAAVGGPQKQIITIVDDERGREVGHWSDIMDGPSVVAVHLHLLPTGQVMYWDRTGNPRLWSPVTNTVSTPALPQPFYDTFCSGHAFLPNGALFVTGGHADPAGGAGADGVGLKNASIYNPFSNSWTVLPDMDTGRWYPTNTVLANGDVLVTSGSVDVAYTENRLPEVWQTQAGTWRKLTDADVDGKPGDPLKPPYPASVDLYPRMFLDPTDPDGTRVYRVGPDKNTWSLETTGLGTWKDESDSNFGNRTYGSAVQLSPGQYLTIGGSNLPTSPVPTNTGEIINLNDTTPTWKTIATAYPGATTPSMAFNRRHLNSTMLPDGTVLVTGGSTGGGFDDNGPVFAAEMWNPDTGNWTTWASTQIRRHYHGSALLLPDGRVLSMGGGDGGAVQDQTSFEIFSPPYLFGGPRPRITEAPAASNYGQSFVVKTPDGANIREAALVRLGSVTHAFDQNQAFITLAPPTLASGGINLTAPAGPTLAPPGHYMLFLLDNNGIPSEAKIIQLGTSVTINRAIGQADPTNGPAIDFNVVFDAPVTGFTATDVDLSGSTVGGTLVVEVSGSGTTYTVTVTGMSGVGKVVARVKDGAATDGFGIGTYASTSTDNSVTFDHPRLVIGPGPGMEPRVKVRDMVTQTEITSFLAYDASFMGGVQVALGDLTGDGVPEIVTAPSQNSIPLVRVFDGQTFTKIKEFNAYATTFTGGLNIGIADVNGDYRPDIITAPGVTGGPHVKVFDGTKVSTGADSELLFQFFAYAPTFTGGVNMAVGDIDNDGKADMVTGAGPTGGPHVKVFSGQDSHLIYDFFAFEGSFTGGTVVKTGDFNDDNRIDIIASRGPGGQPQVRVFNGINSSLLLEFLAYDMGFSGGVRIAAIEMIGDRVTNIVTAPGPSGGPHVKVFRARDAVLISEFFAFDPSFTGGIYVG